MQVGVAVRGETFQATSLHTPYSVETPRADVSTCVGFRVWGRRVGDVQGDVFSPDCGLARLRRRDDVDIVCTSGGFT